MLIPAEAECFHEKIQATIADRASLQIERDLLLSMCGMALDILLSDGYGETSYPVMRLRDAIAGAVR